MLLDDEPVAPLIYALTDCPGARWSWEEVPARNIRLFADAGVRLFQADVWFEQMIGEDDALDVSLAVRQAQGILDQCPDAAVMLRLHVNAPPWWCARHRDECVRYADTEPDEPEPWGLIRPLKEDNVKPWRASFSSRLWRAWAARQIERFCGELAATKQGDSIFGLQLANGVYGEWHQFAFMYHDPDTGPAATNAFRGWLRDRYENEAAFARAWNRPGMRWEDANAPDTPVREAEDVGMLRDPRLRRPVIDYFEFLHGEMADALLGLAGAAKASWPRPLVTAAFQGYFYNQFNRHAAGGHLALDKVLASPHLDCLCAPQSYEAAAREFGGSGQARGLVGAVIRAGKLWLDEMDQATAVCGSPWERSFKSTIEDDVAIMRRNILQPVARGGGAWWFEFGPLAGTPAFAGLGTIGWWDHPRLMEEVRALRRIVAERVAAPLARGADVLVIHDPWSFCHIASRRHSVEAFEFGGQPPTQADPLTPRLVDGLSEALYRSGLIHEDALISELSSIDLSAFRLVIFATTPVLTPVQREWIKTRVAVDGRHVALLGYCGWSDNESVAPANQQTFSPIPVRALVPEKPVSRLALAGIEEEQALSRALPVPAFDVPEENAIGRWADGSCSAACVASDGATWWAFAVAPNAPGIVREIGRKAGCRVVNERDDTTLHGAGMLVVHTVEGGPRTLRLPSGATIERDLPPRSTTVFDARTGEALLA